jgi:hypothetical protein
MGVLPFCRKFLLPYYLKRSGLESGKSCGFRSAARGCGARTGGSGCESMAFVREKSFRSRYHARRKDPGKDSGIPEDKSVGIHFNNCRFCNGTSFFPLPLRATDTFVSLFSTPNPEPKERPSPNPSHHFVATAND